MDLNKEYAAHQQALMHAGLARHECDRRASLAQASLIARRISTFQQGLGAAASCAWSASHLATAVSA
jgi:hypothetical protein